MQKPIDIQDIDVTIPKSQAKKIYGPHSIIDDLDNPGGYSVDYSEYLKFNRNKNAFMWDSYIDNYLNYGPDEQYLLDITEEDYRHSKQLLYKRGTANYNTNLLHIHVSGKYKDFSIKSIREYTYNRLHGIYSPEYEEKRRKEQERYAAKKAAFDKKEAEFAASVKALGITKVPKDKNEKIDKILEVNNSYSGFTTRNSRLGLFHLGDKHIDRLYLEALVYEYQYPERKLDSTNREDFIRDLIKIYSKLGEKIPDNLVDFSFPALKNLKIKLLRKLNVRENFAATSKLYNHKSLFSDFNESIRLSKFGLNSSAKVPLNILQVRIEKYFLSDKTVQAHFINAYLYSFWNGKITSYSDIEYQSFLDKLELGYVEITGGKPPKQFERYYTVIAESYEKFLELCTAQCPVKTKKVILECNLRFKGYDDSILPSISEAKSEYKNIFIPEALQTQRIYYSLAVDFMFNVVGLKNLKIVEHATQD